MSLYFTSKADKSIRLDSAYHGLSWPRPELKMLDTVFTSSLHQPAPICEATVVSLANVSLGLKKDVGSSFRVEPPSLRFNFGGCCSLFSKHQDTVLTVHEATSSYIRISDQRPHGLSRPPAQVAMLDFGH